MDNDLKAAILDAKYIDLIDLAGSLIAEFGEDPAQATELAGPQQQALAAAVFRWAASDVDETIAASTVARAAKAQGATATDDASLQPVADPAPMAGDMAMADPGQPPQDMQMQSDSFGQGAMAPERSDGLTP